ncbi:hypothetical protein EDB74_111167 [Vibrio crassostreae]|nr:hypothetical protein EDB74_111167 [Vibrio crassostreae]
MNVLLENLPLYANIKTKESLVIAFYCVWVTFADPRFSRAIF